MVTNPRPPESQKNAQNPGKVARLKDQKPKENGSDSAEPLKDVG
jgi:hypothetical protein